MPHGRGYSGNITLRSPSGERITIPVPGRYKRGDGVLPNYVRPLSYGWDNESSAVKQGQRKDRRFIRLLSAGWKVIAENGQAVPEAEEEKKNTSEVDGSVRSGDASHGGNHASKEVKNSPNATQDGEKSRQRGSRGGRGKEKSEPYSGYNQTWAQYRRQGLLKRVGGKGLYCPGPVHATPELLKSAKQSAEFLKELIGRSSQKTKSSVTIDAERLLVALEIGDDPLPALEVPDQRPKVKVLVTPDCSGSCQDWSGLGQAWALHLAEIPDVDVIYFTNCNGHFWEVEGGIAVDRILEKESIDLVLYLGDGDGRDDCRKWAEKGAMVIALDSYCAKVCSPRKNSEKIGRGTLHWVDRVSAHSPWSWTESVRLCLTK